MDLDDVIFCCCVGGQVEINVNMVDFVVFFMCLMMKQFICRYNNIQEEIVVEYLLNKINYKG